MKGFAYTGRYEYFLTFCVADRRAVFADEELGSFVATQILQDAAASSFAVPAYVVMPDHGHWLVVGLTDSAALKPFVKLAKQKTGFEFRRRTQQHLWQEGYYETVVRDVVQSLETIRYIVENPVRAGLVQSPQEYPLWGSGTMSREEILRRLSEHPRRPR